MSAFDAVVSSLAGPFERTRVASGRGGGATRAPGDFHVAVLGGGIAGLAAATVLVERGAQVTLFERQSYLGGRAGSWPDQLRDGTTFEMERGFHAFFRQYYNLRALLRRVDPELSSLCELEDYPLLGPNGRRESFSRLPVRPPLNVMSLVRRSSTLRLRDLARVHGRTALSMLAFDPERTFAAYDEGTAKAYLDALGFPPQAREMLFEVFSHSFFNPEDGYSAAELLANFHFYFMGNPEGLVFDVAREPFSKVFWGPLGARLQGLGARVRLGVEVRAIFVEEGKFGLETSSGTDRLDAVVLALDVPGLKRVIEASPSLGTAPWRAQIARLDVTRPFAVWRIWLDRPVRAEREAFAGTAGVGLLDNISIYDQLEGESRAWSARTGGSVVELHAYALPPGISEQTLKADLLTGLHALYPETRDARILEERYLLSQDCPSFAPGSHAQRPGVETPDARVALAGDHLRTEFPCALMEKAAATGFLAANRILAGHFVAEEPVYSVPPRGVLARWIT